MARITLLDGGVGQEIAKRGSATDDPLWATRVLLDRPGLTERVHRDFFEAGATIATANTYAILPDRLSHDGLGDRIGELRALAIEEARAARDAHGFGLVAGAIGPLRATYRPDLFPDHGTAVGEYTDVVTVLSPETDLLIFETVASVGHARAALAAMQATKRPCWLAVTVSDTDGTRLRSGEEVSELVPLVRDSAAEAVLINCSAPEAVGDALDALAGVTCPRGAYANGFETITEEFLAARPAVDRLSARRDMGPDRYADFAADWLSRGAEIVGGCCETGPAHIAAVARHLRAGGHEIA
ncbi:homocysteine S-methyltransferase [Roseivivax halodurans JCM 10272]|uniref:Homocysteine S-methyltransferase n=1 Tax=Roseivivax halodurans JCM 10272 TaxID=1449350 RepID=X7EH42_9RHOB|nr:homocysteine S-methyltransferase family protein [Roseivivax halodurans]ETX15257.1 homocysteine S-methyltransferase [Roseivivax halodurans JCM 10272]